MACTYNSPADLPPVIPIFPLTGALLLPRGQLPLNIFEPRYLSMIDAALKTSRLIGMIQPNGDAKGARQATGVYSVGCAGKITQFAETGDGRYIVSLSGVSRFRMIEELPVTTLYRQCRVDFSEFGVDFDEHHREDEVDRPAVIRALREFARTHKLQVDWKGIEEAPNDALINALAMMSPFGPKEKQALLEAADLKTRADVLVAITEIELARDGDGAGLQ